MKALVVIAALLTIVVALPIQFYLQFQVLKRVDATELMWFLFWINVPLIVLMSCVNKIAEKVR